MMEGAELSTTVDSSPISLYIAAKTMASVTFLQMGFNPWRVEIGTTFHRFSSVLEAMVRREKDRYVFPISCIFVCLEALCGVGQQQGCNARGWLYMMISLIFSKMTALVKLEGLCPPKAFLKDQAVSVFGPVLQKSLDVELRSMGNPQDAVVFRLALCAIRSINSYMAKCIEKHASQSGTSTDVGVCPTNNTEEDDEDDLWGSLDDDILASIDLDAAAGTRMESSNSFYEPLLKRLVEIVDHSKVSSIYCPTSTLPLPPRPTPRLSMHVFCFVYLHPPQTRLSPPLYSLPNGSPSHKLAGAFLVQERVIAIATVSLVRV